MVKDVLPSDPILNQTMPFSERFKIPKENGQFEDFVVLKISIDENQVVDVNYVRQCVEEIIG